MQIQILAAGPIQCLKSLCCCCLLKCWRCLRRLWRSTWAFWYPAVADDGACRDDALTDPAALEDTTCALQLYKSMISSPKACLPQLETIKLSPWRMRPSKALSQGCSSTIAAAHPHCATTAVGLIFWCCNRCPRRWRLTCGTRHSIDRSMGLVDAQRPESDVLW